MNGAISLISRAAHFAALRHTGQKKKGASQPPYINHLTEVACLVAEANGPDDAELIAAAWLHDVVEDGHASLAEITDRFGEDVATLVGELTDDMSLPSDERKQRQVDEIARKSPRARLLKLADKVSNLGEIERDPPEDWSEEKRRAYADWGKKVVDAGCRNLNGELEDRFNATYAAITRQSRENRPIVTER
ncbi:metal dependent phosphohydrolase [Faunimonas pinastri]|uniref:Metal dependent phosphohydrolase n=1 Tax=Faunimonas pinastri TaxID=1855383 RepID=A0A1H9DBV1_9HYPH|nr:HD domain-containing protein [Faunimonas pinastri]SEQ10323.1 metal dependent phosphohydrolase [Faunimonas pinastri]